MHEPILHHCPGAPFAEKVRLILGFKQLSWRSVSVPPALPGPGLLGLTGGRRWMPLLQVGADVYCDSALIARRLEAEKASPALFPEGQEFNVAALAAWADGPLFLLAASLACQPEAISRRFAQSPPGEREALAAVFGSAFEPLPLAQACQQWPTLMARLELQLAHADGDYLFGEPSLADFAVAHPLWLLRTTAWVDVWPAVALWLERVLDFGHGSFCELSAAEAIGIARAATPAPLPAGSEGEGHDWRLGQRVAVAASDAGIEPLAGELLHAGLEELILRHEDPQAGVLHVHLPRLGFRIEAR